MKFFVLFAWLMICVMALLGITEAAFCPCDLSKTKEQICGTNGVTYKNSCEFECTQREYRKLGRTLNIRKTGSCNDGITQL